jgi:hypothetical protein
LVCGNIPKLVLFITDSGGLMLKMVGGLYKIRELGINMQDRGNRTRKMDLVDSKR